MPTTWKLTLAPLPADTSRVLAFNGVEALSEGYCFDILLAVSNIAHQDAPARMHDILRAPLVTLTGTRGAHNGGKGGEKFHRHGMVSAVSYLFHQGNEAIFSISMRPRSYRLSLSKHSYIFLSMSLPDILTKIMKEAQCTPDEDFILDLQGTYDKRPYVCQYNERTLNFLVRHLERQGGYTYIAQESDGDVLTLTDSTENPPSLPMQDNLTYNAQGGTYTDEVVYAFTHTLHATPTKITVTEYATEQPGIIKKTAEDNDNLYGGETLSFFANQSMLSDVDITGNSFDAEKAQKKLTQYTDLALRALNAAAHKVTAQSTVPWLQAGYSITVDDASFLVLSVTHTCSLAQNTVDERILKRAQQIGFVTHDTQGYDNTCCLHPLSVSTYAPSYTQKQPTVAGVLHAKIDASGDGKYAELDEKGRYLVDFFFPEKVFNAGEATSTEGKRSIPLRMAQNHVGNNMGTHFPLLKGTEVLVAFSEGNPDKPFIISALSNPEHTSIVDSANQQDNVIRTTAGHIITLKDTEGSSSIEMKSASGNRFLMDDTPGQRCIRFESPDGSSFFSLHE